MNHEKDNKNNNLNLGVNAKFDMYSTLNPNSKGQLRKES